MTRSIQELRTRRTLCDGIIRQLIQMGSSDPRQPDALAHYREQLKTLDSELAEAERAYRKEHGIPEPEPVIVNLKTAILFPKVNKE
jgi:hypothetical protein